MSKIKGWMLKQRTEDSTVWENVGIPKYSGEQQKIIHAGHGTNLVCEHRNDLWVCFKKTPGHAREYITNDTSRIDVEKRCRDYMRGHPMGERGLYEKKKKPYYIPEPFGLPFELTEKDTFRRR